MDLPKRNTEKIKDNLNFDQKKTLLNKLNSSGFTITSLGHVLLIDVKHPKKGHPKTQDKFLPVGQLRIQFRETDGKFTYDGYSPAYFELVNLDKKFPEDYHSQLKRIASTI
ncbi:Uncharacterised protein [uncultured archaeon]|nr:Uncharacterised protein [uncultured archaeon]